MSWDEMGRDWQQGGAWSRISYVLVLLASLLAFDFEHYGESDRLAPSGAYSVSLDADNDDPTPDVKIPTVPMVVTRNNARLIAELSFVDENDRAAHWSYHFDPRGPPRLI